VELAGNLWLFLKLAEETPEPTFARLLEKLRGLVRTPGQVAEPLTVMVLGAVIMVSTLVADPSMSAETDGRGWSLGSTLSWLSPAANESTGGTSGSRWSSFGIFSSKKTKR
jgi:hypothetical protein